jgi:hypothetical protein
MERDAELLSRSQLSVISAEADHELDGIAQKIASSVRIDGRGELEGLFGRLLAVRDGVKTIAQKTLDLIGHSTAGSSLLVLGSWVIDAANPTVKAFFRELADHDVLPRLGIHAVRLLACRTISTGPAAATVCALADILGVEVFGTHHLLYNVHYDDHGFRSAWEFLLEGSSDVRRATHEPVVVPQADRWPRTLDIDALPVAPLAPRVARWPVRVATAGAARRILQLIRRDAGAHMPGLLATPTCELALASATPGAYHLVHVLLDDAFMRFYPDGIGAPGVVYPVEEPHALRRIIAELRPVDEVHAPRRIVAELPPIDVTH